MSESVEGIYEYWGIQRTGKSTLMVRDMLKLNEFYGFPWESFSTNFRVFIPGVRCMSSRALLEEMARTVYAKERHKVFVFDELGQFLGARNYRDKFQSEIANDLWQFPKRDLVFLYSDNVGNSADIIIRLATWETLAPNYFPGQSREESHLVVDVIKNYMNEVVRGIIVPRVWLFQRLFDTHEPID